MVDVEEEEALETAEVRVKSLPHKLFAKSNAWCTTGRGNYQQSYGPPTQVFGALTISHSFLHSTSDCV